MRNCLVALLLFASAPVFASESLPKNLKASDVYKNLDGTVSFEWPTIDYRGQWVYIRKTAGDIADKSAEFFCKEAGFYRASRVLGSNLKNKELFMYENGEAKVFPNSDSYYTRITCSKSIN